MHYNTYDIQREDRKARKGQTGWAGKGGERRVSNQICPTAP